MLLSTKSKKRNLILTISVLSLIAVTAAVLVIIFLTMQNRSSQESSGLTADAVVTGVIKKMNYTNLTPISKENISRYYEIPENTVCDSAMYISGRSGSETELTCFKLNEGTNEKELMENINDYISSKNLKNPAISETNSSQQNSQAAVQKHQPFIFVVVGPDCSNAVKTFDTIVTNGIKPDSNSQ